MRDKSPSVVTIVAYLPPPVKGVVRTTQFSRRVQQKRYRLPRLSESEILTQFDEPKPLGRHIGELFEFRYNSGDIAVKGGVWTLEVEISDKESDARNRAQVRAVAGSGFVISLESAVKAFDDLFEGTVFFGNRVIV